MTEKDLYSQFLSGNVEAGYSLCAKVGLDSQTFVEFCAAMDAGDSDGMYCAASAAVQLLRGGLAS